MNQASQPRITHELAVARPRLLFVVNHAGFFMSHRLPLALAARDAGYDVHVATPRSKHVPAVTASGLTWHELWLSRAGLNPLQELGSFAALCALYRRVRPHIVHHVTSKPVLYGTLAARLLRVHGVVNAISGMGHVYAEGGLARGALRAGVGLGYRLALRHPHMRIIVQNREHLELFVKQGWIRGSDAVLIAGAGVNLQQFAPRRAPRHGPVKVVLASRLLYTKGVRDFVEAAGLLARRGVDVRCVLVGEPDEDNPASVPLDVLEGWHAQGVVEYRGRQQDMPAVFAEADIVCLPSYYGEGIPKVLIEAAACALPIVTTDWPGCREIVRHGHNGLLVPIKAPGALANALETLAKDPALRVTMGLRGRAMVEQSCSEEAVIRQTLDAYHELDS